MWSTKHKRIFYREVQQGSASKNNHQQSCKNSTKRKVTLQLSTTILKKYTTLL